MGTSDGNQVCGAQGFLIMKIAQDVSEKLIALRAWLSEARQELERQLDREATPRGPAAEAIRQWQAMAIGQLELLRDVAGKVLSTVDVAYDVGLSAPVQDGEFDRR
jgi:hypothetical protein